MGRREVNPFRGGAGAKASPKGRECRFVDPKLGDLPMARVKSRETGMEARTTLALKSYGMSCG